MTVHTMVRWLPRPVPDPGSLVQSIPSRCPGIRKDWRSNIDIASARLIKLSAISAIIKLSDFMKQWFRPLLGLFAILCIFGTAILLFPKDQAPKPNILIVLIDTLRSDHLGLYGYERETSPFMDTLAERSFVYETTYSVSNWTNPTIKSIFTGMFPQSVMTPAFHRKAIKLPLPEELVTFAELARQSGYDTHALVDHPGINANLRFDQGFDSYTLLFGDRRGKKRGWIKSRTQHVEEVFTEMLGNKTESPLLAYLHVVYPHLPYDQIPGRYRGMFGDQHYGEIDRSKRRQLINAYDAQIRQTDDLINNLFRRLAAFQMLENTWVIITSDHGESFWEHGSFEHGKTFFDEEIRVPMIVTPPLGSPLTGGRIATPVSNLDLFATIADLVGQPMPEGSEGFSLANGLIGIEQADERDLFSESPHSDDILARAVISGTHKFHTYPGSDFYIPEMLFDLENDPKETRNVAPDQQPLIQQLRAKLDQHIEKTEIDREWLKQRVIDPDEATLEGLRSLGYIQ